eukprot:CAMPEP_0184644270 /NCGR_PEP_ID=MMETSP0308-20130426/1021_1 /TAXON_ID=38269 /ORGANISM="Gloeochaete witrockiana, Strain SAG 46.84" /LENGTH=104 /DNA_ID=CAMNT_0027072717 /DNA_START=109 /DNA_END=423 /DNA_ORIENTATION=+
MAAFVPLTSSSFLGSSRSFSTQKAGNVCTQSTTVVAASAPFVGKVQGWDDREIKLDIVYPTLNSNQLPRAHYSKIVPFSKFSKEFQRIGKAGGKIVSAKLIGSS